MAEMLLEIVDASPSRVLRNAAANALAGQPDEHVGPRLIDTYAAQTPAVRSAILDTLLARPANAARLLDELESRRIACAELGIDREKRLTNHGDVAVRQRAAKILTTVPPADRKRVLDDYQTRCTWRRIRLPASCCFANTARPAITSATWASTLRPIFPIRG